MSPSNPKGDRDTTPAHFLSQLPPPLAGTHLPSLILV